MNESGQKVGEGSTKPPGFTTPHYFYIYTEDPVKSMENTGHIRYKQ
jgi:hypothetical protein